MTPTANDTDTDLLLIADIDPGAFGHLLSGYGLQVDMLPAGAAIPGSYWGEPEAGLVRPDTPVHSALHEACHYICMDGTRRAGLHTDAGGTDLEENGVCYLQILLADALPGMGRARMWADMDAWGYSFRLGSARAWFEKDAEDALAWLQAQGLVDAGGQVTGQRRF